MDTWTKQPGYPVIEVRQEAQRDEPLELALAQSRFLYDYDPGHSEPDASLWRIPGAVKGGATANARAVSPFVTLIEERHAVVPLPVSAPAQDDGPLIIVNAGRTGFFRVNYSAEMWERSRPAIETKALPTAERLGLAADAFALMRAGYLPATQFLSLARAYAEEREYPVWSDLVGSGMGKILGETVEAPFSAYARSPAGPTRTGWEPQPNESTRRPAPHGAARDRALRGGPGHR
jgi:aminopeptidase N